MWKQLQAAAFRYCPFVYLCISLPVVLFQVFVLPPFQGADEAAHFLRVVHLARGHIVGEKLGEFAAGGPADRTAMRAFPPYVYMHGKFDAKLDGHKLSETRQLVWTKRDQPDHAFSTSVIYPPYMYIPAIAGVKIGQATKRNVLDTIYFARFLTALTAIALSTFALVLSGPGRTTLFMLLCFPMTLHLYSYIAQDALTISLAALFAGVCSRAYAAQGRISLASGVALSLMMGCIAAARPPMLPLVGVFLLPLFSGQLGNGVPRWYLDRRLLYVALSAIIALSWIQLGATPLKVPFRQQDGVSMSGQFQFLLSHLTEIPLIALTTMEAFGLGYLYQIVGVLGHLDTPLPSWYYALAVFPAIAAVVTDSTRSQNGLRAIDAWVILALGGISAAGIFFTLYLGWTPVGIRHVEGVQGRYFLPILMICAICIPCRPRGDGGNGLVTALNGCAWMTVYGFAVYNLWLVPRVILVRYIG